MWHRLRDVGSEGLGGVPGCVISGQSHHCQRRNCNLLLYKEHLTRQRSEQTSNYIREHGNAPANLSHPASLMLVCLRAADQGTGVASLEDAPRGRAHRNTQKYCQKQAHAGIAHRNAPVHGGADVQLWRVARAGQEAVRVGVVARKELDDGFDVRGRCGSRGWVAPSSARLVPWEGRNWRRPGKPALEPQLRGSASPSRRVSTGSRCAILSAGGRLVWRRK